MSSSGTCRLIEVFGHIVFRFTRSVTEHCYPEEPEFTAESFGYNPQQSTGRERNCHHVDELIYQEYSDREATSSTNYLACSRLDVVVMNACSTEENQDTQDEQQNRIGAMAWKRSRPSASHTVCKSMYFGALISLLTAIFIGTIYMLISYLCYKTIYNCEYSKQAIPFQVQWLRTISGVIFDAFHFIWYFTAIHLLFRPFQLIGVKRKLFLTCFLVYCLDALYRVVILQALTKSKSKIVALQKNPSTILLYSVPNILFVVSLCLQVYFTTNHFGACSRRRKLTLFFLMIVPTCLPIIVGAVLAYHIYPAYNKQDNEGKLLIALFSPLIGVFVKVISRICVQKLYNITHPGCSCVLLAPLYFGSAVMFRVLQADLGSLKYMAILGIIHGAAEVIERSTMVVIDHICHRLWKRESAPWGSFRSPRRERLMADIAIMSMLFESTAIVSVNGYLYLYQFVYLQDKSLLNLLQSYAIYTSVQLVIEWFFTSASVAIETRYQNMAVMAVWRRRWKRHILVAIVNAVPLAIWTSGNLLVIVHGRFDGSLNRPCKMPFT